MTDLRTPATETDQSFKAHYRRLILGAIQHSARSEQELQVAMGHRLRARRARHRALELDGLSSSATHGRRAHGKGAERTTRLGWSATVVYLAASLFVAGVGSWWTGAGDLALIALTFSWFFLASRELERDEASEGLAPAGPAG